VIAADPAYSTVVAYGRAARWFHWLVAGLAVVVVSLGWASAQAPRNTPARDLVLVLHRSVGLTILALMVCRALWRWRHAPPPLPPSVGALERALAGAAHAMLYALFITMPVTGYLDAAAAGHAVSFFGIVEIPPLIAEDDRLSQVAIAAHLVGQYLIYLFVGLHVAAALLHGAIRRDSVLDRMLPARYAGRRPAMVGVQAGSAATRARRARK
jgi:cytochrome b561